jgi:hypothetical protein
VIDMIANDAEGCGHGFGVGLREEERRNSRWRIPSIRNFFALWHSTNGYCNIWMRIFAYNVGMRGFRPADVFCPSFFLNGLFGPLVDRVMCVWVGLR